MSPDKTLSPLEVFPSGVYSESGKCLINLLSSKGVLGKEISFMLLGRSMLENHRTKKVLILILRENLVEKTEASPLGSG